MKKLGISARPWVGKSMGIWWGFLVWLVRVVVDQDFLSRFKSSWFGKICFNCRISFNIGLISRKVYELKKVVRRDQSRFKGVCRNFGETF